MFQETINQVITAAIGLGLLGGTHAIWLLTGVANNLFSIKRWSWKRTGEDLLKTFLMVVATLGWVIFFNALEWFSKKMNMDISAFLDGVNVAGVIAITAGGSAYRMYQAYKNIANFIGTAHIAKINGSQDYEAVANAAIAGAKQLAEILTPHHTANDDQTDESANPTEEEIEVGQGSSDNPLNRRLPDGDNDYGKGWQCSKYSWYLASGIRMNYAPNPDFGPCNGDAMVDYLVNKLGWVRCGKENGAIFAYKSGAYGHTGMVVDAANNIVNDANWTPLKVSTHYLNLDAVGAVYCKPKSMVTAPAQVETPKSTTPTSSQNKLTTKPAVTNEPKEVTYKYKKGDNFGKVILDLGLNTSHGLWGADGDVEYYTSQLHAQGIFGNIPVGKTIKLTPRE